MKTFAGRHAIRAGAALLFLAGCRGSTTALPQTFAPARPAGNASYKIVHSFGYQSNDGFNPVAGLIDVGGTLYGTTEYGGTFSNNCPSHGCGAVFALTPSGTEKVIYSFGSLNRAYDGEFPVAGVTNVNGTLYGTTPAGGYLGDGTVFRLTTSGTLKVLHDFPENLNDGTEPTASLVDVRDALYGTTFGRGIAFSITTSGNETILLNLHSKANGRYPAASLIYVGGAFYGTTAKGGARDLGTVFSFTPASGTETVLHSFGKGADGQRPYTSLVELNGAIYGTTKYGGAHSCVVELGEENCGTVFVITANGTEKVLHSFGKGTDGAFPVAPLIEMNGTLYGTTEYGGAYSCPYSRDNCGTLFSITPDGTEKVLHSFGNGSDGSYPEAGLIDVAGTLYGTTRSGGTDGNGTVFAFTP